MEKVEEKGLTYCRPHYEYKPKIKNKDKYCPICGFKKRGASHDCGEHHKRAVRDLERSTR